MQVFCKNASGGGAIWEAPNTTNLKAWDDSSLLLHYKNAEQKSRILLLYNDGKLAESGNSRRSLGLYYLAESVLDSAPKSQKDAKFVFLQNIDAVDEAYPNEVSYPSAVIDENALFVGYTYNRKGIKVKKIELAEIERKIAESRGNSSLGMQFRTCEKFWESTDSGLVLSQNFSQIQKPYCKYFDFDSQSESPMKKTQNTESALDSADSQNLVKKYCHSKSFFCHSERSEESQKKNNRDSSVAMLPQNDNIDLDSATCVQNTESSLDSADFTLSKQEANSSIFDEKSGLCSHERGNRTDEFIDEASGKLPDLSQKDAEFADIVGVYLLFLSAFFFATKSLSRRAKYLALPCFVTLISIPFIFVLWDYYSIITLFYSLFGGASVFCALLCARYILVEILPRRFCESQNLVVLFEILRFAQNDKKMAHNDKCKGDSANSRNLALILALFSIPLFLGHLGLVNFDILRNEIASAIFVSAFIVALFWVDKWAFIFALIALILTKSLFGLFDGYLLIFSVVYCAIWAIIKIYSKIIAQA